MQAHDLDQSSSRRSGHKRLTVLQVIPRLDSGGAERSTVEVARALIVAGHRAVVATAGGRLVDALRAADADIVPLPVDSRNPLTVWRNGTRLAKAIGRYRADLIHARSRAPAWSAYRAARTAGVPFLTTYHGTYSGTSGMKRLYNSIMARGDRVIANSHFVADLLRDTYRLPAERIVVIPRGVDATEFSPDAVPIVRKHTVLRDWGIESRRGQIVLMAARLTSWKGQIVLLDAVSRLDADRRRSLIVVLLGDDKEGGDFRREIEARIGALKLTGTVVIPGHCADMPAAYAVADVVVSPSTRPEAFGRVAVEAQAMGKPVIVSDHGGARETVVAGETGWRVPPSDPASLAAALREALDLAPPERAALAERARRHVTRSYSVAQMCDKTIALYEAMVSQGSRALMRRI